MNAPPREFITLRSFPQAILHVDADAFFASVEQAIHPEYRGKPVVTGAERGIIAAASYEAKALGAQRGVSLLEARQKIPHLIVLPTDYETCGLYSKRLFDIMRRYTDQVEEYSVDEGFADLTGLRRLYRASYQDIARRLQQEVHHDLGITVSVGLSLSKSLAKLCSDFRKPAGFTAVPGKYLDLLLRRIPVEDIWGVWDNTATLLKHRGIMTAFDYTQRPERFHKHLTGKIGSELWRELRGEYVYRIDPSPKTDYQSVIKSKTFTPSSAESSLVFAQLLRNLESACSKVRRYNLAATMMGIFLRTATYEHHNAHAKINRASNLTSELATVLRILFDQVYQRDTLYRATGVVLAKLEGALPQQTGLFDDPLRIDKLEKVTLTMDQLNTKYGQNTIHLAASLPANQQHWTVRGVLPQRQQSLFKGENSRQRLHLPQWFVKV